MKIGYARVSTQDQNIQPQIDELKRAGCSKIFTDKVSGVKAWRSGLEKCKEILRPGDVLVVWRLDRLGRSLKDLIEIVNEFEKSNIGLQSITESINTETPAGKLIFHIFAVLAEFERALIAERTRAGLAAARVRGRKGGRPNKLDKDKIELVRELYNNGNLGIDRICQMIGISKPTLYKYIKK
ncbi:MAG: recombinase family protein [Candidatus Thorarchaeota archaeon]